MKKAIKEMLDQLTALAELDKYDSDQKQAIEIIYEKVTGEEFKRTGCPDCYHDAVVEAAAYIKKHGDVKKVNAYELVYGEYFSLGGFGSTELYTRHNMKDKDAIAYLAATNGEGIDKFRKYPDNWQEDVERFKAEDVEANNDSDDDTSDDEDASVEYEDTETNEK